MTETDIGLGPCARCGHDIRLALRGKCIDCGHSVNRHDIVPLAGNDLHSRLEFYIGEGPGGRPGEPRHGFCRTCGCDWLIADPEGVNLA